MPDSLSQIEVNAAKPGLWKSSLIRNFKNRRIVYAVGSFLTFLFAKTTEEGGRSIAYAAVAGRGGSDEKPFHGKFISTCDVRAVSSFVLSETGQTAEGRLWVSLNAYSLSFCTNLTLRLGIGTDGAD